MSEHNEAGNIDDLLREYVLQANATGFEAYVTLSVGGLLVSGILVGGGQYIAGIAQGWRNTFLVSGKPIVADQIEKAILQHGQFFYDMSDKAEKAIQENRRPEFDQDELNPRYIHLKDAKIIQSGQIVTPVTGVWWRGRLDAVDGWNFGMVTVQTF